MIQFQDSSWLWLLPVVLPLLLLLMFRTSRDRARLLGRFASHHLMSGLTASFSSFRQKWKYTLVLVALVLLILALARPQWGSEWREARGKGIDILFVVDASKSMLAQDIAPNRLARAKLAILDLIDELDGDRLGLVAFSGNAFLQCPLTLDYDAFRQSLDVVQPGLLSQGGTDFGAAIEEAAATFEEGDNFKFVILITDGEDLAGNALAQAREAAQQNIKIYTVGVGSPEGERIPVYDNRGRPSYLRDDRGNFVLTRLDQSTLKEIADLTGGFYVPLGTTGEGLQAVLSQGLANVPREELGSRLESIPVERYQLFLLLAILLLVWDSLLGNRRKDKKSPPSPTKIKKTTIKHSPLSIKHFPLLLLLLLPQPLPAQGNQKALELYSESNYDAAEKAFQQFAEKDPENLLHRYNAGCAAFQNGNLEKAAKIFREVLRSTDLDLQADAFYNLGNTRFRLGQEIRQTNPEATIEYWEEALNHYQNALELRPEDTNAAYNYRVVKDLLDQLKQQQEQEQQQQEQQNQEQDQSQDQNQDSSNQDQQQQQSDSRGDQQQPSDSGDSRQNQSPQQEPSSESGDQPDPQNQPPPPSEREITGEDSGQEPQEQPESGEGRPLQAVPMQMTPREAEQLLEALRQNEKKLPVTGYGDEEQPQNPKDLKDW